MLIKITIIATILLFLIAIISYVIIFIERRQRNIEIFEKIRRTGKHYIREGDKFVKYDFMPGKTINDVIDEVFQDDKR